MQAEKAVRIQSEGTTGDFTVDSIFITHTPASGGETPASDPSSDGETSTSDPSSDGAEDNKGKDTLVGPGFVLNGDYPGATGVVKFPTSPGTIDIGIWKEVNASTPAGGLN